MQKDAHSYYSISEFYKKRFGEKTVKIPVTVADDCPNRRGLKGMQTCVFCDVWGSAAYAEQQDQSLKAQIEKHLAAIGSRHNARSFLIYFQAYTSTFLGVAKLRNHFEEALAVPGVKGFVIGTRPDCLSKAVLDLWSEYSARCFVSVELGVQSFYNQHLQFLRRGHSAETSIAAIGKIKSVTPVDLGIHLIFGLPGETREQIVKTAELVSKLPVDNVKLHNLHVLKNTPLEEIYNKGQFTPLSLEDYAERIGLFLQHLDPRIAVHRLAALSSRWDELVAPEWTKYHLKTYQFMNDYFSSRQLEQGQLIQARRRLNS
jgi:uncharacterized protein